MPHTAASCCFYLDRDRGTLVELAYLPAPGRYSACAYIDAQASRADRPAYARSIAAQLDEWRQEQGIPFDKSTLPAHPADSDSGEFDTVEEALGYLYTCLHCPDSVLC